MARNCCREFGGPFTEEEVEKRYKLRERERHVNIQAIVEEHYERYFDQEEEYMREDEINYVQY